MSPDAPNTAEICRYIHLLSDNSLCQVPQHSFTEHVSLYVCFSVSQNPISFFLGNKAVCVGEALRVKIEALIYSLIETSED